MDRPSDELLQRLLGALARAEHSDVARLVDDARAEAEAEVKGVIKSAMKAVLLRRTVEQLEDGEPGRPAAPSPPAAVVEDAPHARPDPASAGPTACYVYGITRAARATPPRDLRGVGGSPLRTTRAGDLEAITAEVSLDEFGPGAIDERLKDLQWVEQNVRAHDAALKALSDAGTVIPCRFCTILPAEDDVRASLERHHDAIVATLDALDGKKEWGVKLTADTRAAPAAEREPSSGDSGRAYLMQKKRRGGQREEVLRLAAEAAEQCHRELFALAADAALLPARDRGAARGWHLSLNAAYLVADSGAPAFHAKVAELSQRYHPHGLRIDLTGPWPPYTFVALNLSDAPPDAGP